MTAPIVIPPLLIACLTDGSYGELQSAAEAVVSVAQSPQRTPAALTEPCKRVAAQHALLGTLEAGGVPMALLPALTAACATAEDNEQDAYSEGARAGKGEEWATAQERLLIVLEQFGVTLASIDYDGKMADADR